MYLMIAVWYVMMGILYAILHVETLGVTIVKYGYYTRGSQILLTLMFILLWPRWAYNYMLGFIEAFKQSKKKES